MAEPQPKKKTQEPAKSAQKLRVRATPPVTELIHLFTHQRFGLEPVEVDEIDSWLRAQLDAKKLEVL